MIYGIVVDGAVTHWYGSGNVRQGPSPDPDTVFRIASMTKSFTAAAVLLLRDEGVIRLDDEASAWIPELRSVSGPTTDSPPLTLRHLLTMSAGWIEDDPWADRQLAATPEELNRWLAGQPRHSHGIGTHFEYSNLGYAALGRLIHNASGQRFQEFVSRRILTPLGLQHTVWSPAQLGSGAIVAEGHHGAEIEPDVADGEFAAMGGLWSSVNDLARWVGFFTEAFPPRNEPETGPLRRSSRREQQQAARTFPPELRRIGLDGNWRLQSGGYGMGLNVVDDLDLGAIVFHGGGLPGFGSAMRWLPARGFGVLALANRTYAPMIPFATEALELLQRAGALSPTRLTATLQDTSAVLAAGRRLGGLFAAWEDEAAADLFSMNVDLDEPVAARGAAAEALRHRHGGLRVVGVTAVDRARGTVRLKGATGEVAISFSLSPLAAAQVQAYSITETIEPAERLVSAARGFVLGEQVGELAASGTDPASLIELAARQQQAFGRGELGHVVSSRGPLEATFAVRCPATELLLDLAIDKSGGILRAAFRHPTRRPSY